MLSKPGTAVVLSFPLLAFAGTPLGAFGGPLETSPHSIVHGKRSFYISPSCAGSWCPWPEGKHTWCQVGDTEDPFLQESWTAGWNMWVDAFGGSSRASLTTSYQGLCKDDSKYEHLHVTLTDKKRAATTAGWRKPVSNPSEPQMVMSFDLASDWGTGSVAANLAHEMGHSFGLLHEHQKWMAWHSDLSGDPPRPDPLVKLNCENLYDYDKFKDEGADMKGLCSGLLFFAAGRGFSAADMLPWGEVTTHEQSADFDWKSIMLYGSSAGAKEVGKKTLVKFDGGDIAWNLNPSGRDGEAIRILYPA
ncbi:hypothetical protein EJ04DRAFT_582369 [Polyplosphaeria fusca]|uniref:Peptidase M10 metallopeptidase domain-containing protein n=1 Tax=Polyplosphaeria fusca TaxID=682080 RepID=A0A9P4UWA1_9PLEO|nr:hypothetical protein EJ04DRAFT_582369 [Polyplosphaeria fusca]